MTKKTFLIPQITSIIATNAIHISLGIAIVTLGNIIAQYTSTWQPELIPSQIGIGFTAAIIPILIKNNKRKISQITPILKDIAENNNKVKILLGEINSIEKSVLGNIFPSAITLVGLFSLVVFGSPWRGWNLIAHNLFSIFAIIFFLIAGSLGWQYLAILTMLYKASKLDIQSEIFTWPARQIKRINQVTMEIYFAGLLVYVGAILSVGALPWGVGLLTSNNLFTQLWVFPIALAVIGYFLAIQYFMHRIIIESKDVRLEKVDERLEVLLDKKDSNPSDAKLKLLSELIIWRKSIKSESEWPLNIQSSLGVIVGVLLPTLGSILDLFAKFFSN